MDIANTALGQSTAQRVTASALLHFAKKGFQATGIRDIADGANMSSAALYHYMETKEHLLLEIMRHALNAWYETTFQVVAESQGAAERLCNFVRSSVICSGLFKLESTVADTEIRSLKGKNRQEIVALRDRYESLMDEILRDGIADGTFEVSDPRLLRLGILEMCNGVSRWYSSSGRLSIEDVADEMSNFSLFAARATRNGQPVTRAMLALQPTSEIVLVAKKCFE
jgi:AcrR family transcriptional regulator